MSKSRVRLWGFGGPRKFVEVDTDATEGAVLGINLRRQDGSIVTETDLLGGGTDGTPGTPGTPGAPGAPANTLWRLIREIPQWILNLAAVPSDPSKWLPIKDVVANGEIVTISPQYQLIFSDHFEVEVGGIVNVDGDLSIL